MYCVCLAKNYWPEDQFWSCADFLHKSFFGNCRNWASAASAKPSRLRTCLAAFFLKIVQLLLQRGLALLQCLDLGVAVFDVGNTIFVVRSDLNAADSVFLDFFSQLSDLLINFGYLI